MENIVHKIVILIPFRNARNYIIDCVTSVFNQIYPNYEIYLLDDDSDDGTLDEITQEFPNLHKIKNKKRLGSMENLYQALTTLPLNDEDIVVLLDGDDLIFGEYAFQMLNSKYNEESILLTYGQFITNYGETGGCFPYTKEEFKNLRKAPWKASHLKTFKYKLFKKLLALDPAAKYFKYDDGSFFMASSDQAIMIPLLEIAGYDGSFCFRNVLYCYRLHSNNKHINTSGKTAQLKANQCIRNKEPLIF